MNRLNFVSAFFVASLMASLQGCNFLPGQSESQPNESPSTQVSPSTQPSTTIQFRDAVNKAMEAAKLTQTAKTSEEWAKVAENWQQAINLMKSVPESSANYLVAQRKVTEYQNNLQYAKQAAASLGNASQPSESPTSPSIPISEKAAQLQTGMTYQAVISLLGRQPDTVVNDQIRQELGELPQGNDLIKFEWANDNPNCHPVSAQFNPLDMTLTGWDQGLTCTGPSLFNKPFGKPCAETQLCKAQ